MTTPRQELLAAFAKLEARDRERSEAIASLDSVNDQNPHDYLPHIDDHFAGSDSLERLGPPPQTIGDVIREHDERTARGQLPFDPEPRHSTVCGTWRSPDHDDEPEPLEEDTIDDDALLCGAFFAKHPDATCVEVICHRRFERSQNAPSRRQLTVRYEVWITLANRHTIIEQATTFDELIQIAEQPANEG